MKTTKIPLHEGFIFINKQNYRISMFIRSEWCHFKRASNVNKNLYNLSNKITNELLIEIRNRMHVPRIFSRKAYSAPFSKYCHHAFVYSTCMYEKPILMKCVIKPNHTYVHSEFSVCSVTNSHLLFVRLLLNLTFLIKFSVILKTNKCVQWEQKTTKSIPISISIPLWNINILQGLDSDFSFFFQCTSAS